MLAVSVTFATFFLVVVAGSYKRSTVKTTQMSEYLVITPDLVWVTICRRTARTPSHGGGAVSWRVFPSPSCRCSWLFSLAVWVEGKRGLGREGQCSIFIKVFSYVHRVLNLIITSNLKNGKPAPPLSNLRSRKQHHHWQMGTIFENIHTFGTGHNPTDHILGCALTLEIYLIF